MIVMHSVQHLAQALVQNSLHARMRADVDTRAQSHGDRRRSSVPVAIAAHKLVSLQDHQLSQAHAHVHVCACDVIV